MKIILVCVALFAAVAANSKVLRVEKILPNIEVPHELKVLRKLAVPKFMLEALKNKIIHGADERQLVATVNEYTDLLMKGLDQFIIESGMDPMPLPDIYQSFEYQPIIITYHGELNMTEGMLYDVSTMHRGGDAILKYEFGLLNLQIPLAFNDLIFNFNYHADIMDLGPTGTVDGSVVNVVIYFDLMLDLYNMEVLLQDFRIDSAGDITVNFHGNDLIDWLIELLVEVATWALHDTVIGMVEGSVYTTVEDILLGMNELLQGIFTLP